MTLCATCHKDGHSYRYADQLATCRRFKARRATCEHCQRTIRLKTPRIYYECHHYDFRPRVDVPVVH